MTQMGRRRQWWPRLTTPTSTTTAVDTLYTTRNFSTTLSERSSSSSSSCCGLSRLLRKLKRQSNKMLKSAASIRSTASYSCSRQSSFQCRYDPLSYALNFDTTGTGSHVSDEDYYYKFCAFSSRFVAASTTPKHELLQATN
ncbi:hypothetical protein HAX54_010717 [Datura stramonium]|uniref:Uncharacterized protein n=1 Tax=Datura stramonium TaxID=4076 RepID=A0ABS8TGU4_DATST|nr:hypothetical protein [Datura stramonium]